MIFWLAIIVGLFLILISFINPHTTLDWWGRGYGLFLIILSLFALIKERKTKNKP